MTLKVNQGIDEAKLSAVIIRADGSKEDLGEIAYFSKNPIKRIMWKIKKLFKVG